MQTAKRIIISCLILLSLLMTANVAYAQSGTLSEIVLQATVKVIVFDPDRQQAISNGSGSIISPNGLVLTNYHVVDESVERYNGLVVIEMPADRRASRFAGYIGRVITYDPEADLAVVQITHTLEDKEIDHNDFPFIPHGSSRDLMEGDQVYAIGYPDTAGGRRSVTQGIVSAIWEEEGWILSDVDISNGNSGGPLLNTEGQLIGIPTWGEKGEQSGEVLGYSRPIEMAEPIIEAAKQPIDPLLPKVLCEEDFRSNRRGWYVGSDSGGLLSSETLLTQGVYQRIIRFKKGAYDWTNIPDCEYENYELSLDVTILDASSAETGVLFLLRSRQDDDKRYHYRVTYFLDNSYKIELNNGGEWTTLQERTTATALHLDSERPNRLSVRVVGTEITVKANGETLTTIFNDQLADSGKIAFGLIGAADDLLNVAFDNLEVVDHRHPGVILEDAFVDNRNQWKLGAVTSETILCEDRLTDGYLIQHITVKDTTDSCHSITDQLIAQDFWLTVEGTMVVATEEDSWLNIAFRYDRETGRRYELVVDRDGHYGFYLYDGDEWHTLQRWTQSNFINQGTRETNTIQLWVRGPYATLTINDIELITVEDDRIAEPGHILLGLEGEANAGALVAYDNLLVLANPPTER